MTNAFRLGGFVVAALAIFCAGVFWIGSRSFLFTSTYRLYADFPNVAGLSSGATVRVGGVHEGAVGRIMLPQKPDQKIRVQMDLKESTRNVIKQDSVAAIRTEGLVGDQYVEITFGSPESPSVKDGDTVAAEPPLQISDMMKKTNTILDSVSQTTGNLQAITAKVNQGQGSVGQLINDRSVYQHVSEAASNLQDDTEALKHNFLLRGFFKNRGYEDNKELTRHAIAQLPSSTPAQQFEYVPGKLFDKPDSAKLKSTKMLDEAGQYLEANQYGLVVVAAYADLKGDTDKQRQNTEARAAVVRDYLAQHFKLDDTRIKTLGAGKSSSAQDGGSVEILVYPVGVTASAEKNAKAARGGH